jgi:methyltransferase NSUN6
MSRATAVCFADPFPENFEVESFDRVLLDGPCTGIGQRPRLLVSVKLVELEMTARYQRMMMQQAAHVLKVGGYMVYSTCTLDPQENEGNVSWFLRRYPEIELVPHAPRLGGPGLHGKAHVPTSDGGIRVEEWLGQHDAGLVQRFGPDAGCDTIAFFIAKFRKRASIPTDDLSRPIPKWL